jgi:hypothetical protein
MFNHLLPRGLRVCSAWVALVAFLPVAPVVASDSAFTYQGYLTAGGVSANGSYDMQFRLMAGPVGELPVSGEVVLPAVIVADGVFTVLLPFDSASIGAGAPSERWLEIAVRKSGSASDRTVLVPRQKLTSVPFAAWAAAAGTAASAQSLSGTLSPANIAPQTIARGMLEPGLLPAPVSTNASIVNAAPNQSYMATGNDFQVFELPAGVSNGTQVEITGQNFGGWATFTPWAPLKLPTGIEHRLCDGTCPTDLSFNRWR